MKKESYYLEPDYPMYDMCYCCANCSTDCARRKAVSGIHTVSDFSKVCKEYKDNLE